MKKPVLMVSPIPSHPQFQGNSARIYRMGRLFQLAGHPVHFVYYGLEGLTPQEREANEHCWDTFHYIQPLGAVSDMTMGDHYHVDDWFDYRVGELVEAITEQWDYAACLVHYVWFSKVLESVPESVVKIIDTHDVFGDRHLVAKAAGLEPVWFYTSSQLEGLALERADLVLAIQEEEAKYFRTITQTSVMSLGYIIPDHWLPQPSSRPDGKLCVGYLGSSNPFNVRSMRLFEEAVLRYPELLERYEFHLAGAICREFEGGENEVFKNWGVVGEVSEFYREMHILLNPMVGGTGLKIKSIEVMAFRRPLMATADAMVGICPENEPSVYSSPLSMVEALVSNPNLDEPEGLGVDQMVWSHYVDSTYRQFRKLLQRLSEDNNG